MENGIRIFALAGSYELKIAAGEEIVNTFMLRMLHAFGCVSGYSENKLQLNMVVMFSDENRKELTAIANEYSEYSKHMFGFIHLISKIKKNEFVAILPSSFELSQRERMDLYDNIYTLNGVSQHYVQKNDVLQIFDTYIVDVARGGKIRRFGSVRGEKIVCRYCSLSSPVVTFKQKAHLIPEGLGNKAIISNDECDICNEKFGRGIDRDIINFFSVLRTMFGVKGKGGSPTLKGRNFSIRNNGTQDVNIEVRGDTSGSIENGDFSVICAHNEKISFQNIYRSLCKYAISMLGHEELTPFAKTIEWINCDFDAILLPKVAQLVMDSHFDVHPKIHIYKRTATSDDLPLLVGEFHFTCMVLVFIVPEFRDESISFCTDEQYAIFWSHFTHLSQIPGWTFMNISSPDPIDFCVNLNFKKHEQVK